MIFVFEKQSRSSFCVAPYLQRWLPDAAHDKTRQQFLGNEPSVESVARTLNAHTGEVEMP